MAHNINRNAINGRDAFYSLRESAWHGLGQVVDAPVSDPEVLSLAGLEWDVRKVPLCTADDANAIVEDFRATVRSDTGEILGVVGKDYEPVQNGELLEWFRGVAGAREMTIETAGALGKGERVWALARIPDLFQAMGKDQSQGYMLISTGHNGRHPLTITPTVIRVVCQNTLGMALRARGKAGLAHGWNVRHTAGVRVAMADIADAYRRTIEAWAVTKETNAKLASVASTHETLTHIVREAFQVERSADESARAKTIRDNREARIKAIRAGSTCNVEGTRGTVYSDLQAVTEYIDHEGGDIADRFNSAMFGGARAEAKSRAFDAACELAAV